MAIMSLNANQGEDTRSVSDMSIQFKRISVTESVSYSQTDVADRAAAQRAGFTQNGNIGLRNFSYTETATAIARMNPNP
jgi:hypothetical protein